MSHSDICPIVIIIMIMTIAELKRLVNEAMTDGHAMIALGGPKWRAPSLVDEISELIRVSREDNVSLHGLIDAFAVGKLVQLPPTMWRNMENTDSSQDITIERAKKLAVDRGKDIDSIIKCFKGRSVIDAPTVLLRDGFNPTCVAGNTRLMVSRAFNIQPMVFLIYP